jgi:O-methyltransferase involved in polyketide biosynthesis
VDFERQELHAELSRCGFRNEPTFFSWLGVTPYLTHEAFHATVSFLASLPAPSGVVFDYAVKASSLSLLERVALRALTARVSAAGEAFRLFFTPAELEQEMSGRGFTHIEDLDKAAINARYFQNRRDGLKISGGLGRLMSARR